MGWAQVTLERLSPASLARRAIDGAHEFTVDLAPIDVRRVELVHPVGAQRTAGAAACARGTRRRPGEGAAAPRTCPCSEFTASGSTRVFVFRLDATHRTRTRGLASRPHPICADAICRTACSSSRRSSLAFHGNRTRARIREWWAGQRRRRGSRRTWGCRSPSVEGASINASYVAEQQSCAGSGAVGRMPASMGRCAQNERPDSCAARS